MIEVKTTGQQTNKIVISF